MSTHPSCSSLLSVSTTKGRSAIGNVSTGGDVNFVLSYSKLSNCALFGSNSSGSVLRSCLFIGSAMEVKSFMERR